jgi:hypothetical protein
MPEMFGRSEWVRPKAWKLDWELRKDGQVVATMSSPHLFGTAVSATFGDDSYSMRKGGLRRPGAVIRKHREEGKVAVLELDAIGKGTIILGSSTYQWERLGSSDRWTLSQEGRGVIFAVDRDTGSKYPRRKVDVDIGDPHLAPLLLLTWFVVSTSEC